MLYLAIPLLLLVEGRPIEANIDIWSGRPIETCSGYLVTTKATSERTMYLVCRGPDGPVRLTLSGAYVT